MSLIIFTGGISCYDDNKKEQFTLRAHILAWTGDIPALSKVVCLTGHNSYSGCRFCNLQGRVWNRLYHLVLNSVSPGFLIIRFEPGSCYENRFEWCNRMPKPVLY